MSLHIVLHQPEIPQNTGNIARTCAVLGASLHVIRPLGFSIDDKHLKRAGLDYWHLVTVHVYEDDEHFFSIHRNEPVIMFSTKAQQLYTDLNYPDTTWLMFGRESGGLPEAWLVENREHTVRIPMGSESRSLNLSNAVAIAAYEYSRQHDFAGLQKKGSLHTLNWET